jgi:anaerobic selenocysteine-containing dehydrogenase
MELISNESWRDRSSCSVCCEPLFERLQQQALPKPLRKPFVVSFSLFVDETAVWADLILPDHTYLESWGFQVSPWGGSTCQQQQPVVRPMYDTRPLQMY